MPDTPEPQAIALFRYGLIADFIHQPLGSPGLYARLRERAAADCTIPGSSRVRVAPETLRHWLKAYRLGGFDALAPKGRADRGQSRALPQTLADALLSLKEEQPHLSIPKLFSAVSSVGPVPEGVTLAPSTVHRLLSRAGLMDKTAEDTGDNKDRRRFAHPGQLWMSDVMHGPTVAMPDSRIQRKAYLIAFLDDATRLIPYCAFALSENTQAFLAGVQASAAASRHPAAPVRGQRCELPLPAARPGVRPPGRGADPRPALPTQGQGVCCIVHLICRIGWNLPLMLRTAPPSSPGVDA